MPPPPQKNQTEETDKDSEDDKAKRKFMPLLWKNLAQSLSETKTEPVYATDTSAANHHHQQQHPGTAASGTAPIQKKVKRERLLGFKLIDPFKVWIHIKEFESLEDGDILLPEALPKTLGVKLSEIGVAGMINGMAAISGDGLVDKHLKLVQQQAGGGTAGEIQTTAGPVTLAQLRDWSELLHQATQSRLEKDVLDSTPQRIADMLAPDLSPAEFRGVRRRVYDTVILGKGLKVDDGLDDIPVANTSQSVHDIEKVGFILYYQYPLVTA